MSSNMHRFDSAPARFWVRSAAVAAAVVLGTGIPAFAKKPVSPPPPPPPPPTNAPAPDKVDGTQFFSWYQTSGTANYPVNTYPTGATTGSYVGVPFLSDGNVAAVSSYLASPASGTVKAVKVMNPISNATAAAIFNNSGYHVSYVFGDLEGANAQTNAATLANQVRWLNGNVSGTPTQSARAYIGNFGFSAQGNNLQAPANYSFTGQHSFSGYQYNQWTAAGLNMSNEEAYPGSPSFRNKAAGDKPQGSGTYSNIRAQLFVLPLWRVGNVTDSVQEHGIQVHQNIAYTANFNNWGNLGLDNDRDASTGYVFTPGAPMVAKTVGGVSYPAMTAQQTQDQLLSRRDFATMITHMRLRGADSYHLLDSGISNVTRQDMEQDAAAGWLGESSVNSILSSGDKHLLIGLEPVPTSYYSAGNYSGGSIVWVDGVQKNVDQTGAIFSGAYSLALKKLDVLISNEDDSAHTITLPSTIAGYSLATKDFTVLGGDHVLVEFSLLKQGNSNKWGVAGQHVPFTAISNSRGGFGIPEPGTLSMLAISAVFCLNNRRRKALPKTA